MLDCTVPAAPVATLKKSFSIITTYVVLPRLLRQLKPRGYCISIGKAGEPHFLKCYIGKRKIALYTGIGL